MGFLSWNDGLGAKFYHYLSGEVNLYAEHPDEAGPFNVIHLDFQESEILSFT